MAGPSQGPGALQQEGREAAVLGSPTHGTQTAADSGHTAPLSSGTPTHGIPGTHSGRTPFRSGCEHTRNDKGINASWLIHLADVAWWVRDTHLGVMLGTHFTSLGLGFLICRMRSLTAWSRGPALAGLSLCVYTCVLRGPRALP